MIISLFAYITFEDTVVIVVVDKMVVVEFKIVVVVVMDKMVVVEFKIVVVVVVD